MKLKGIDIAFAQETHSNALNEVYWKREWEGLVILSHKSSKSKESSLQIHFCQSHMRWRKL